MPYNFMARLDIVGPIFIWPWGRWDTLDDCTRSWKDNNSWTNWTRSIKEVTIVPTDQSCPQKMVKNALKRIVDHANILLMIYKLFDYFSRRPYDLHQFSALLSSVLTRLRMIGMVKRCFVFVISCSQDKRSGILFYFELRIFIFNGIFGSRAYYHYGSDIFLFLESSRNYTLF